MQRDAAREIGHTRDSASMCYRYSIGIDPHAPLSLDPTLSFLSSVHWPEYILTSEI